MREHGGYRLVGIVDRRADRARDAAARLGLERHAAATGLDELPFADEIEAVTCGTAPFAHHAVVKSALVAGKHAITEKPFTMTLAEGEDLVELARKRGLVLGVIHNFQFARAALKLRRWIDAGRLGRIRSVRAVQLSNPRRRLPDWFDELPFGLFYDESPHLIYLAREFGGAELAPVGVTVHRSTRGLVNTPARIDAQMSAGDIPVSINIDLEAPVSEWHVVVMGDEGMALLDVFRDLVVYLPNDRGHRALNVLRTSSSFTRDHFRGYFRSGYRHVRGIQRYGNEEVFARFHRAIVEGGAPAGVSAQDALAVLRIQHWILEAGRESLARAA